MYPIERYLLKLKSYVKSKSHPKGCIAEAYLVDECLTFCSRYTKGVETRLNRPSRNNDDGGIIENVLPIFSMPGRPLGKGQLKILDNTRNIAHRYVSSNCQAVEPYKNEHLKLISEKYPNLRAIDKDKIHNEQFPEWFKVQIDTLKDTLDSPFLDDLKRLAEGPHKVFRSYKKFMINGFRFHTKDVEAKQKTQNSGVIVTAETQSFSRTERNMIIGEVTYYGVLNEIIELDFLFEKRIILFKCDWFSQRGKKNEKDCTLVNFNYLMNENDPFILASQAEQVMYVPDLKNKGWQIAIKIVPRDFYDMTSQLSGDNVDNYLQSVLPNTSDLVDNNNSSLVREDMEPEVVDIPLPQVSSEEDSEDGEHDSEEEDEDLDLLF